MTVGLVHSVRSDAGHRKIALEVVGLIEGMALRKPRPSVAAILRRIVAVAEMRHWPAPSLASVHAIVRNLDPAMVTLAHEGVAAYRDRFELIHRHRAERPNAVWQADHTELDMLVRFPIRQSTCPPSRGLPLSFRTERGWPVTVGLTDACSCRQSGVMASTGRTAR